MLAKPVVVSILMQVCAWAQAAKPPCNGHNLGDLWPARDAHDSCRAVEMCVLNVWKYRWEPVTEPISQLAKGAKHGTSCETARGTARAPAEQSEPSARQVTR